MRGRGRIRRFALRARYYACGPTLWSSLLLAGSFLVGATAAADELRVLRLRHHAANHPHRDLAAEYDLLNAFARAGGHTLRWLEAVRPAELVERLRRGEGDVLIADPGPQAPADLVATLPVGRYRYLAIGRSALRVSNPTELGGKRFAVTLSSPLWPYLEGVAARIPGFELVVLPDDVSRDQVVNGIAAGEYEGAAVALAHGPLGLPAGIVPWFEFSATQDAAWYLAPSRRALAAELNGFLDRYHAAVTRPLPRADERRTLRVITRVDPQNYFLRRGRPGGFEHGLVSAFAVAHARRVDWLVAASDEQALKWLREGRGDIVTTRIDRAMADAEPSLRASRSYYHGSAILIARRDDVPGALASLSGRAIGVPRDSNAHRVLAALNREGLGARLVVVHPGTPPEALGAMLARGEVSVAAVAQQVVHDVLEAVPSAVTALSLPDRRPYRWLVHERDDELAHAAGQFLRDAWRNETYNVLANRYVRRPRYLNYLAEPGLSPYDDLARRYAEQHNFDWRLIVALMFQESQFDPLAESDAGARGLMQLLPATAADLGVVDPFDPAESIRGGVAYLDQLRRHFRREVPPAERIWFALAAYNWGLARVAEARVEAAAAGLDPDRWFGAVEQILERRVARAGGCRCGETLAYVRTVRSLYRSYNRVHRTLTGGAPGEPLASIALP